VYYLWRILKWLRFRNFSVRVPSHFRWQLCSETLILRPIKIKWFEMHSNGLISVKLVFPYGFPPFSACLLVTGVLQTAVVGGGGPGSGAPDLLCTKCDRSGLGLYWHVFKCHEKCIFCTKNPLNGISNCLLGLLLFIFVEFDGSIFCHFILRSHYTVAFGCDRFAAPTKSYVLSLKMPCC